MSWRDVLAVTEFADNSYAQYPHNTQKGSESDDSADIADSAEEDPRILKAIAIAAGDQPITPRDVLNGLAPQDIDDWRKGEISTESLATIARCLVQRKEMYEGKVPAHYTKIAICKGCGPVWLWITGEILGCPWCWNRAAGLPIPRPTVNLSRHLTAP